MKNLSLVLSLLMMAGSTVYSQIDSASHYDQHLAFDPLFYPSNGNAYRSASGQPGPAYWQNRADYKIVASLDTAEHLVKGSVLINKKKTAPVVFIFLGRQVNKNFKGKEGGKKAT